MSSVSGIGSYTPHLAPEADPQSAATVARPDGTSGAFSTGLSFDRATGDSIEDASALLVLTALKADSSDVAMNRVKSALSRYAGALSALASNAAQRKQLANENADNLRMIAELQQQMADAAANLMTAQDKLNKDQLLDPLDPDLVKADQEAIAAIQAAIAQFLQSIATAQSQSAGNESRINTLQISYLSGFTSVASLILRRVADEQQAALADTQATIGAVLNLYADLQDFLANAQALQDQRLVQNRKADKDDLTQRTLAPTSEPPPTPTVAKADDRRQIDERDQGHVGSTPTSLNDPGDAANTAPASSDAGPVTASSADTAPNDQPRTTAASLQDVTREAADRIDEARTSTADAKARQNTAAAQAARDLARPEDAARATAASTRPAPPEDPGPNDARPGDVNGMTLKRRSIRDNSDDAEILDRASDVRLTDAQVQQAYLAAQDTLGRNLVTRVETLLAALDHFSKQSSAATPSGDGLSVARLQDNLGRLRIPI